MELRKLTGFIWYT